MQNTPRQRQEDGQTQTTDTKHTRTHTHTHSLSRPVPPPTLWAYVSQLRYDFHGPICSCFGAGVAALKQSAAQASTPCEHWAATAACVCYALFSPSSRPPLCLALFQRKEQEKSSTRNSSNRPVSSHQPQHSTNKHTSGHWHACVSLEHGCHGECVWVEALILFDFVVDLERHLRSAKLGA